MLLLLVYPSPLGVGVAWQQQQQHLEATVTDDEYRAIVIETILEMVLTQLEDQAAVKSAWTEFLNLAQPIRAADESRWRALADAANDYATALAQRAFLAGLRFDARALLQEAAAEFGAA